MSPSHLHPQRSPLSAVQFAWVHWLRKHRQNVVIFSVRHALRLQLLYRVNALPAGKELFLKNSLEYSFLQPVDCRLLKIWPCKLFNTIFWSMSGSIVEQLVDLRKRDCYGGFHLDHSDTMITVLEEMLWKRIISLWKNRNIQSTLLKSSEVLRLQLYKRMFVPTFLSFVLGYLVVCSIMRLLQSENKVISFSSSVTSVLVFTFIVNFW